MRSDFNARDAGHLASFAVSVRR